MCRPQRPAQCRLGCEAAANTYGSCFCCGLAPLRMAECDGDSPRRIPVKGCPHWGLPPVANGWACRVPFVWAGCAAQREYLGNRFTAAITAAVIVFLLVFVVVGKIRLSFRPAHPRHASNVLSHFPSLRISNVGASLLPFARWLCWALADAFHHITPEKLR